MTAADAPTVFVVDDDAGVRASIQGLLNRRGYGARPLGRRKNFCATNHRTDKLALFWT